MNAACERHSLVALEQNHVTPQIGTFENIAILENRSKGHARGDTANGTQLVAQSSRNQENDQPSQQIAQRRDRLDLLGTSAVVFAHEVGNPLQAIFVALEFIEARFKTRQIVDPFLLPMIQRAMREVHRLHELLREFRSLAKPHDLDLQLADLVKIIDEVMAQQRLGCRAAGIAVKLECEKPLPPVMLDAAKITQAILNLCKNAVEAMPNGGCLSIRVYPSGPMIVMEIADSGVGVAGDVDVFQLFTTTKSGGSGLGISVVQQIVSAHKGTINYTTEPGRGTTFTVNLPAINRNGIPL
jgi:signal transduction histidine kinase